ncbi:relaxase/mobilization nuclease domain-containing protein [Pseudanabaenaceae cyanobacterium LEGE 13415]|nr:relaxase/mobilization nuclease domain-containing protein [Pseudanabaenaceae cyanobacterium LEGE 13415]
MLAKITKGRDFYGCLRYVIEREKADRIGGNMEGVTLQELVAEFNLSVQRQQRHSPRNFAQVLVCHTSLSVEVGRNLDVQTWNAIAKDYLNAMGFDDNQFVMIRHTDTQHDHVHLVIARSRLDGTMVNGWFDYRKAQLVLRKLEQDYQLQSVPSSWETEVKAPTVSEVRRFRQTGEPSVRVLLQVAIDDVLSTSTDLNDFRQRLSEYGVEIRLRQITTGIAGISYKLNGIAFPGFKLGKRYTWSRIQTQLGENYYERRNETSCQVEAGTTEPHFIDPIASDVDRQFGTSSATRTEAETCSSFGGSGEEFDSRESVTAPVRESPSADSDADRESISAFNQPKATDRNKYATDEFDSGRASGESADIPAGSSRPQKRDRSSSIDKHDIQSEPFRDQVSESTSDRAGKNSEPGATETDRPLDRISEPTSPTSPGWVKICGLLAMYAISTACTVVLMLRYLPPQITPTHPVTQNDRHK